MGDKSETYFVKLPRRGLVQVEGADARPFLQNLISNDMDLLEGAPCLYACLLTAQGKFLHDFFVLKGNGFFLLDCEGGDRAQDLYRRLSNYRLRSKVQISVEDDHAVYAVMGGGNDITDPRHPALGGRTFEKPEHATEKSFDYWDRLRIGLGVPDGSRDMVVEQSTLIECGVDRVNGASFTKGCYVGQELTARLHHRGLAKKHLVPVRISDPQLKPGDDIAADGKIIGQMRSRCGDIGLALLRDDALGMLTEGPVFPMNSSNLLP